MTVNKTLEEESELGILSVENGAQLGRLPPPPLLTSCSSPPARQASVSRGERTDHPRHTWMWAQEKENTNY